MKRKKLKKLPHVSDEKMIRVAKNFLSEFNNNKEMALISLKQIQKYGASNLCFIIGWLDFDNGYKLGIFPEKMYAFEYYYRIQKIIIEL
jgi:hypothetical protein